LGAHIQWKYPIGEKEKNEAAAHQKNGNLARLTSLLGGNLLNHMAGSSKKVQERLKLLMSTQLTVLTCIPHLSEIGHGECQCANGAFKLTFTPPPLSRLRMVSKWWKQHILPKLLPWVRLLV
jgi:hypothetical protein